MPLTSQSRVQITASSAKSMWLARHRESEILGNNGFALDGEIYIRNEKYLSIGPRYRTECFQKLIVFAV